MKTRRFFAVFLLFALLTSLFAVSPALADETQTASQTPPTIDIAAKAALLVDRKTGVAVYAKNEHEELYPASLTKIMTACWCWRPWTAAS
jgi:D-alanyl-D-alanine carboxypeptidase (penicillin-binding protein 5/6)